MLKGDVVDSQTFGKDSCIGIDTAKPAKECWFRSVQQLRDVLCALFWREDSV